MHMTSNPMVPVAKICGKARMVHLLGRCAFYLDNAVVAWVESYAIMWEPDMPSPDVHTAAALSPASLDQG